MSCMGQSRYVFVIDTEQYAGNFERALCAYVTGHAGECGVGLPESEEFGTDKQSAGLTGSVIYVGSVIYEPDDHGCCRPCDIWPTPGWFNNGHANFRNGAAGQKRALASYKAATKKEAKVRIKEVSRIEKILRAGEKHGCWTWATCEEARRLHNKTIEKAEQHLTSPRFPAYMSVGIFFDQAPSSTAISTMKARAAGFNARRCRDQYSEDITITGFRLIERQTVKKALAL